jgi:hypothetical protein
VPAITKFGFEREFLFAIADTLVPYRDAIVDNVSPGRTVWVAVVATGAGAATDPPPPESFSFVPATMKFGSEMPFARARADAVVPARAAIAPNVSPGRTV